MIPILGRGLVLVALGACSAGALIAFVSGYRRDPVGAGLARQMALLYAGVIVLAGLLLEFALVTHDFSVSYVAEVGNLSTPLYLALASLWSGRDGSILLWGVVLAVEALVFARVSARRDTRNGSYALGVIFVIGAFYSLLSAGPACPFNSVSPVPSDGPGPNPLLQNHILMIAHPPALYLGYVGMAIPFGMGIASLLSGRLDAVWLRSIRRWNLFAWTFLTLGILLGGWWSYEVLGWGGYWAWDPVENASLLPWLTSTALLHSVVATQRRRLYIGWTMVLVVASFLLTMLGTFMTRSGIFNSVHSFTQSAIGPVFLAFIGFLLLACVLILSSGVERLNRSARPLARPLSKEGSFLLGNLVLTVITLTVLLGSLYPLIHEVLTGEKISIGAPYYNKMAIPMLVALLLLMALAPVLPWGGALRRGLWKQYFVPLGAALAAFGLALALGARNPWALMTYSVSAMAATVTFHELWAAARSSAGKGGRGLPGIFRLRRRTAANLVHLGVILSAVAIAASSTQGRQQEMNFVPGETVDWQGWTLNYVGIDLADEGFRVAERANFRVSRGDRMVGVVQPAMTHYRTSSQPIATPGVLARIGGDLYISLVQMDRKEHSVSVKVILEPLVSWLWVGGLLMVAAGLMATWPHGFRPSFSTVNSSPGPSATEESSPGHASSADVVASSPSRAKGEDRP